VRRALVVRRNPSIFKAFSDKNVAFAALIGKANIPLSEKIPMVKPPSTGGPSS
jgi:hypothetical protein